MLTQTPIHHRVAGGLVVLALCAAPALAADPGEETFYRAYYLQIEEGELEAALALYREVAKDTRAPKALRKRAADRAAAVGEDLAARDFARLMPADAIVYAELNRPGEQLGALLDQLGLLADDSSLAAGRVGISPALLSGALGLNGAALAITEIDPHGGPPSGVLVLHPGELDVVRGLIETAIPAAGVQIDAIGGHPTWTIEGQAFVTLTSRLVVVGTDPDEIEGVIARMRGQRRDSLAESHALAAAMESRGEDLLFFCINAEPVRPLIHGLLREQAQRDPEAAMALALLDVESFQGIAGRLDVDGEGLALDVSLHLEEGHRNLIFNLMRMPNLDRGTLEMVPEGVAFFLAGALNEAAPIAPGATDGKGQPVVTWMDFGREVFANIADFAIYALPPEGRSKGGPPIPDVACVVRVNDPVRSKALWNLVLGLGSQAATGGSMEPQVTEIQGVPTEIYNLGEVPIFLATREHELVFTPSRTAMQRTLAAAKRGRTVFDDPLFAPALAGMHDANTSALVLSPGRCMRLAEPFMSPGDLREIAPIAQLLEETVIALGVEHSDTHMALRARVHNVPDVSPLLQQLLEQRRSMSYRTAQVARGRAETARAVAREVVAEQDPETPEEWIAHFDQHACVEKNRDAAMKCAQQLVASMGDDARALNNFAWALLTEARYGEGYDELAKKVSERSNELSDHGNWYYLDTLGLACFRTGELARAVKLQEKALRLAGDSEGADAVRDSLERYRRALEISASGAPKGA